MMNTRVIACKTLEEELGAAMREVGAEYPVTWMDSGLHKWPQKLRETLQNELRAAADGGAERILLCMGFCGNAIAGIDSGPAEVILPRSDDCITMMFGSFKNRMAIPDAAGTFFVLKGFLTGDLDIWDDYMQSVEKYGEEDALEILETIYANYKKFSVIDTHIYDIAPAIETAGKLAALLNIDSDIVDGSYGYLKELLTGPWPEARFIVIPPHTVVDERELVLSPDQ